MSAVIEVKNLQKYFSTPKGMLHAVDGVTMKIVYGHIALGDIGVLARLGHFRLYLVGLVPYVAHKLIQSVLHGYYAHGAAVFVDDDGKLGLELLELADDGRKLHRLGDITGRHENALHILKGGVVHKGLEKMVDKQHAEDIVGGIAVDGYPRIGRFKDPLLYLIHAVVDIYGYHIDARREYLLSRDVGKLKSRL